MFRARFGRGKNNTFSQVKHVNAQQLAQKIENNEDIVLVDVRTPGEFEYDGRITDSRLIPLSMLSSRLDELPKDKPIICICRSGNRSHTACEHLVVNGFSDVTNLDGGIIGWRIAGLPHQ